MLKRWLSLPLLALSLIAGPAAALSAADQIEIGKAETFLNGISTLKAHLLQISPDGSTSEGTFYLKRPGHLRLEYDPPNTTLVRASAKYLYYTDKDDAAQRAYADIDNMPALNVLMESQVDLNKGKLMVTGVGHAPGITRITVTNRDEPGQGKITLVFTDAPYTLKQWQVLDPQGQTTTVSLYDAHTGLDLDDGLFNFPEPNEKRKRF